MTRINPSREDGEGVNPWIRIHDKGSTGEMGASVFDIACLSESSTICDNTNGFAEQAEMASSALPALNFLILIILTGMRTCRLWDHSSLVALST